MKTTSAFMAVCTALLMFSCSGDDENSQSTPLQLKTTTSSPAKGEIGTKITIIGENFTDQAKVYLKNAKATIFTMFSSGVVLKFSPMIVISVFSVPELGLMELTTGV